MRSMPAPDQAHPIEREVGGQVGSDQNSLSWKNVDWWLSQGYGVTCQPCSPVWTHQGFASQGPDPLTQPKLMGASACLIQPCGWIAIDAAALMFS